MDNYSKTELNKKLDKLRQQYYKKLPNELTVIKSLSVEIANGNFRHTDLEELHSRLHKLAGSGGTFGLSELSQKAHSLEQQLKHWLNNDLNNVGNEERQEFASHASTLHYNHPNPLDTTPIESIKQSPATDTPIEIWLVVDDPLLAPELASQLESFFFTVRVFLLIQAAEKAAAKSCPDMLLLDVLLEKENTNSTQIFNTLPNLKNLNCPLIFISAFDDFHSRVRAAQLGAEGYFLKPLNAPRLANRLVQIFDKRNAPQPKVLIIEDDTDLAEHFRIILINAGMHVTILQQPEKIINELASFRPELILMDLYMPMYSGKDLSSVIRQHDNWSSIPIVFLSAETDINQQACAMHTGADDFLTKPISGAQLISAIRIRTERARELNAQISKDSLTSLLKHANIKEAAEVEVIRAKRSGKPTTLVMLDIDFFKSVNDTYGHAKGDIVISSVAMLLRQRLRQSDIIGRYGGEEFLAVLPECDADSAFYLIDDIRQRLSAILFHHEGQNFTCTISAGLACSDQYPEIDTNALLIAADQALYTAKKGGRNKVETSIPNISKKFT